MIHCVSLGCRSGFIDYFMDQEGQFSLADGEAYFANEVVETRCIKRDLSTPILFTFLYFNMLSHSLI